MEIYLYNKPLLEQFKFAREFAQKLRLCEGDENWDIYAQGFDYDDTFAPLMTREELEEIVMDRRESGKKTIGLDLMGYGAGIRGLSLDFGISIGLSDPRSLLLRETDFSKNLTHLKGDIMSGQTWRGINTYLDLLRLQGVADSRFHITTCRPIAGLDALPPNPTFWLGLLERLYFRMSFDNSLLLSQVPSCADKYLPQWTKRVNSISGLFATYSKPESSIPYYEPWYVLRLLKGIDAPECLPVDTLTLPELTNLT